MDVHFVEKHELAPYPLDVTIKLNSDVVGFNCNHGTHNSSDSTCVSSSHNLDTSAGTVMIKMVSEVRFYLFLHPSLVSVEGLYQFLQARSLDVTVLVEVNHILHG